MRLMSWMRWQWPPLTFDAVVYVAVALAIVIAAGVWRLL
jgi:hypothetical protein